MFCLGRFASQATGEHTFYSRGDTNLGRALESAKSNALMRCCKDLGIASELWDPQVSRGFQFNLVSNTSHLSGLRLSINFSYPDSNFKK